jgi:hypothetical protein
VEEEKARKEEEELERKRRRAEDMKEEFEDYQRTRWKGRRVRAQFHKAEVTLAQLEKREIVPEPKKDGDEDEKEKEGEEEQIITEEVCSCIIICVLYNLGGVLNKMPVECTRHLFSNLRIQFHQLSILKKCHFD